MLRPVEPVVAIVEIFLAAFRGEVRASLLVNLRCIGLDGSRHSIAVVFPKVTQKPIIARDPRKRERGDYSRREPESLDVHFLTKTSASNPLIAIARGILGSSEISMQTSSTPMPC